MRISRILFASATSAVLFVVSALAAPLAAQTAGAAAQKTTEKVENAAGTAKHAKKVAAKTPMPSAQEVADAKAKGLVWVNLNSGVYHKEGERFGKTKHGQFMTEDEAKKAGHRAAKEPMAKKVAKAAHTTSSKEDGAKK